MWGSKTLHFPFRAKKIEKIRPRRVLMTLALQPDLSRKVWRELSIQRVESFTAQNFCNKILVFVKVRGFVERLFRWCQKCLIGDGAICRAKQDKALGDNILTLLISTTPLRTTQPIIQYFINKKYPIIRFIIFWTRLILSSKFAIQFTLRAYTK